MPKLQVYVPDDVAQVLARQSRSLLLGRQQYIRAILAAVAEQDDPEQAPQEVGQPSGSGRRESSRQPAEAAS